MWGGSWATSLDFLSLVWGSQRGRSSRVVSPAPSRAEDLVRATPRETVAFRVVSSSCSGVGVASRFFSGRTSGV